MKQYLGYLSLFSCKWSAVVTAANCGPTCLLSICLNQAAVWTGSMFVIVEMSLRSSLHVATIMLLPSWVGLLTTAQDLCCIFRSHITCDSVWITEQEHILLVCMLNRKFLVFVYVNPKAASSFWRITYVAYHRVRSWSSFFSTCIVH